MKSKIKITVKKIIGIAMMFVMMFSITACDSHAKQQPIKDNDKQSVNNSDTETLVVYFSWSGNTKKIAGKIKDEVNGDIFRIITEETYPDTYDETLKVAKKELDENARPKLSTHIESFDKYDTIFVGYPNWWQNMPMALYAFFDEYDFSGKTIVPFCTNGGSGLSDTVNTIKKLEPNANILDGLEIRDNKIDSSDKDITNWLQGLNIKK